MAERKGFEPSKAYTLHAFQACSFNHSDTSLKFNIKILRLSGNRKLCNYSNDFYEFCSV